MPAKHSIDNSNKLIVTTWVGEANDIEFIETLKNYQKDIQCKTEYIDYNEVVDFRGAVISKVTISGLIRLGEVASKTDNLFSNKRSALIVNSNMVFGLAKIYEAYRSFEKNPCKKIRVFKNKSHALDWVKVDSDEDK